MNSNRLCVTIPDILTYDFVIALGIPYRSDGYSPQTDGAIFEIQMLLIHKNASDYPKGEECVADRKDGVIFKKY